MDRAQLLNDSEEAQRLVLDGRQSCIWTALPAIVQSADLTAMTCEVQPAIQGSVENEDGTITVVNLPLLVDVPICYPSGGGFALTFPLVAGDEVLVVMASRCIDSWWQLGGIQKPIEARMHDLSDGFAIPGPKSQPRKLSGISSSGVQLRSNDGTKVIGISGAGKLKLANSTKDLLGVLNGMIDLLNTLNTNLTTFAGTVSGDPIATVTAGAAAALTPQLAALAAQLALYKTANIGALLE